MPCFGAPILMHTQLLEKDMFTLFNNEAASPPPSVSLLMCK